MLALALDVVGGYHLAKHVRSRGLLILPALLVGLLSAVLGTMLQSILLAAVLDEVARPGYAMARALGGVVWHPIITIVAAFLWAAQLCLGLKPLRPPNPNPHLRGAMTIPADMTIPKAMVWARAMVAGAIFLGLLFGDRYQIVLAPAPGSSVWRIDKLTRVVSACYGNGECRVITREIKVP
jgi:hypothetical protein